MRLTIGNRRILTPEGYRITIHIGAGWVCTLGLVSGGIWVLGVLLLGCLHGQAREYLVVHGQLVRVHRVLRFVVRALNNLVLRQPTHAL